MGKRATQYFTPFIAAAVFLVASHSSAFGHRDVKGITRRAQSLGDAEALFESALVLSDNGEKEAARFRLQQAISLWVQMREPGKAGMAALLMGDRYKRDRAYRDALNCYSQALDIT